MLQGSLVCWVGILFLILPVVRAVLALCCCCEEAMGCGLCRRRQKERGNGLEEVGCGQRRQEPVAAWHSSPGFYLPEGDDCIAPWWASLSVR